MLEKKQMENYIKELKRLAIKKRGVIPNSTSKTHDIQKLTEERKNKNKKEKIVENRYSRSVKPVVTNQITKNKKTASNRNLESLSYKSALVSLKDKKITRLNLPHGSFNAGIAENPGGGYICVYRPDEHSFAGCFLDNNYQITQRSHHKFKLTNCADPRLVWVDNKLLMVYSSTTDVGVRRECIRGSLIMDLNISNNFLDNEQFRISPVCEERHKNWMPFIYNNLVFLISHVSPHKIYELNIHNKKCELKYENQWFSPWPIKESLRGSTNAVRLSNGNYLSTFHTAIWENNKCHYDNGTYIFEGKPPFKVLKCSNKTFLPAEDAVEPHYRKHNSILCPFPVGMIAKENKIIISYGDNDSSVKILETSLQELENLMLEVY